MTEPEKKEAAKTQVALTREGQRVINLIWESTQRNIALMVVATTLTVNGWLAVVGTSIQSIAALIFLVGGANLVIGFYFGRTNHQKTGGIGLDDQGR